MSIKVGRRLKVLYYFMSADNNPVEPGIYEVIAMYPSNITCVIKKVDGSTPSMQVTVNELLNNAVSPDPNDYSGSNKYDDEYSMFDPVLPEGNNPVVPKCYHEYTVYVGLTDTFEYCKLCGLKRDVIKKEEATDDKKAQWLGRIS